MRTDGHDETNSRFSKFCEGALKKTDHLMLYSEIIAVLSDSHTQHTKLNTLCGQDVGFLNTKPNPKKSNH